MLVGQQITIKSEVLGEVTIALANDNHLCMKMITHKADGTEEEWWSHNIDHSLKNFLDIADKLSEDEIDIIASNTALIKLKRDRVI